MSAAVRAQAAVRHFVLFSAGQGVSSVGSWMHKAAVGWLSWELTHSAVWVGVMALTDLFSALLVAPFAGAVADRGNPYRLMWLTQLLLLVQALMLFILQAHGWLSFGLLLAMTIIESTVQGFNQPVRMIVTGNLAGPERMSQAVASNSIAVAVARSIGPAVAGLVMLSGRTEYVFLANAVSFLAMLLAISYVRSWIDHPGHAGSEPLLGDIVDGFRYVIRTPDITSIFVLTLAFAILARPFAELFPAFAGAVFGGGPQTLSLLMSAQGVGALIGAAWIWRRGKREALPGLVQGFSLGLTVALLLFTATRNLYVAVPAMVLAGLCHVVCNIAMQSLAQLQSAPAMRGRVLALYGLLFRTAPAVGAFLIAQATRWISLQWLVGGAAFVYGCFMLGRLLLQRRSTFTDLALAEAIPVPTQQTRNSS